MTHSEIVRADPTRWSKLKRALGLKDRKADAATIRQAYMNKAKVCHPDVNDSPEVPPRQKKSMAHYAASACLRTLKALSWSFQVWARSNVNFRISLDRPLRTSGKSLTPTSGVSFVCLSDPRPCLPLSLG